MVQVLIFIAGLYFSVSQLQAGTEIQNGGGGISINGEVATFYSAELKILPEPLPPNEDFIKLEELLGKLSIPNRVKVELFQNIQPSYTRRYYSVDQNYVNSALLEKIKLEYSRITGLDIKNLTVFALTDPETQITLLLPDYFKLTPSEKRAILFHESLWINNRVKNYSEMLKIEKSAQIYFTFPDDCVSNALILDELEKIFQERLWTLTNSLKCEINKYLRFSHDSVVPFLDFFDHPSLGVLAELLVNSTPFNQPKNLQIQLARVLQAERSNIFNLSQTALARELVKGLYVRVEFSPRLRTKFGNNLPSIINTVHEELLNAKFNIKEDDANQKIVLSSIEIGQIHFSIKNDSSIK